MRITVTLIVTTITIITLAIIPTLTTITIITIKHNDDNNNNNNKQPHMAPMGILEIFMVLWLGRVFFISRIDSNGRDWHCGLCL